MTTLADKAILSGADNRPPMLEKELYDSWKTKMVLYMMNRQHGRMILESVEHGLLIWPGLPNEIYALVSHHKVTKDLWERIQLLMQGTSLTKQERECKLYDEFNKFAYKKGETLRPTPSNRPTKVEVSKELSKFGMVNTSLKKLKHNLASFDVVFKERTTATAIAEGTENSVSNQTAPSFDHYLELNELKAQSQEKDTVISKLKETTKSLTLKNDLRKLKGKSIVDDDVTSHTIAPEMLKVNVEPLAPKLLNNRTSHSDYLRHTQEQATILKKHSKLNANSELICVKCNGRLLSDNHALCILNDVNARDKSKSVKKNLKRTVWKPTGKVFTNIGYIWRPSDRTFTIVGNSCPLNRITNTTEVPSRNPIALETNTPKPVVTLVYSRKPRKSKTTDPVGKSKVVQIVLWYLDSDCSKHMTKDRSQLTNFVNKFLGFTTWKDLDITYSPLDNFVMRTLKLLFINTPATFASKTKSWLWHRRLSYLNFGSLNHLARHGLVRGLRKLKVEKDHLCSACAMDKSKKKPHKPKSEDTNQEDLYLLHMDLCGPMRVASVSGKTMELYMMNRQHGRMILESVKNGPLAWPLIKENGVIRPKKYSELSDTETIQDDCDVKATNIIIQGLLPEVYALVSNHKVAKELWERIQLLMQRTLLTKQERESIHQQSKFSSPDTGLVVLVFQKGNDPIDAINHMMSSLTAVVTSRYPATNNQLRTSSNPLQQATINNGRVTIQPIQGRQNPMTAGLSRPYTSGSSGTSGKQRVIVCYNYKGEGHMSKQCTKPKRKRDEAWFKKKVLLVQAQANGQVLHEEESEFLADPGINRDCKHSNLSHYGSDNLVEVHNQDNVTNNLIDQDVQATSTSEQSNILNQSKTGITSDSNIISYSQYMNESQYTTDHNLSSPALQGDLILSVVEQLKTQVVYYTKNNQDNKNVNEILTAELERYKNKNSMNFSDPNPFKRPTKVEVPKELPKVGMVNTSLKKLKHQLVGFLTWMSKTEPCPQRSLRAQRDKVVSNQSDPSFDQYFEINELKAQLQEKNTVISKLKERIKSRSENVNEDKTYKQLYDSIKPTRVRSKEQSDALINQSNLKSVEISDLNVNLQEQSLIMAALRDELRKLKGKAIVDNAVTTHTIDPKMLKVDVEPIAPRLLNNRTVHSDYLRLTQEQAVILREVVKQGKSQSPLNNSLDHASSSSNLVSNKPTLSSTRVKPSTSTSRSQPLGNTKKDKIHRPPDSTQKNNVEAHRRTFKSSLKNKNCDVEPKGTITVQHSKLNANFEFICVKCHGCMPSDNHDLCVLNAINDVNARSKSKFAKKNLKRKVWKPTGKDAGMSLTAYADADHAGCPDTRRSTSGSDQFI
nr:retrovirus-related Pol polyprotein from transposon TNT 1-94 [Tanacetum cinerariifolium]